MPSLHDHLEEKSVHELLVGINEEDKKVAVAVEKAIPQIEKLVEAIVPKMKRGGRIFYLGAGTSGRLGVLDASEIPPTYGMPNTYVIGALHHCRKAGILTASISCNPGSPVSREADIPIEIIVGPEFVTGSTRMKSGTAQKLVLNMISTATMIKMGRVKGNRMVNMQLTNQKLIDRGARMIVEETGLDYDTAKELLLLHRSVKKAVDEYMKHQ